MAAANVPDGTLPIPPSSEAFVNHLKLTGDNDNVPPLLPPLPPPMSATKQTIFAEDSDIPDDIPVATGNTTVRIQNSITTSLSSL